MRSQGRRRRTRCRKPRFLSLRQQIAPPTLPETTQSDHHHHRHQQQQQQQLLDPKLDDEEESPSSLFEPDYDMAATLNSIFGSTTVDSPESPSDSVSHGFPLPDEHASLARVALKGRERWVFCKEEEEGESTTSTYGGTTQRSEPHLCLKLDYEKIVSAWSGKGSLYVEAEEHQVQVVPQLHHPSMFVEVGRNHVGTNTASACSCSGLCTVPENSKDQWMEINKHGSREERVMRYREKRHSRLFSKRIRYEVRKTNAEKRPRIKGRFVKRMA